jgi:hypothetical protein
MTFSLRAYFGYSTRQMTATSGAEFDKTPEQPLNGDHLSSKDLAPIPLACTLLRHANSSVTLNLYAQAVTDIKRNAQSKVARLVFGKKAESEK